MTDSDVRTTERERSQEGLTTSHYESTLALMEARRTRATSGRIVLKRSEVHWESGRQGHAGFYLHHDIQDTALQDWRVFAHEIHTHSGRHTHQGGLVLYVTKGAGTTVVNGNADDWGEGDLLILPVQPGGCDHQHFNNDPDQASEWVAFIYAPLMFATGALFEQTENSPTWKGTSGGS